MNPQPISGALSQELTLQILDAWGRTVDLAASFEYDAGDPWAVWITFRGTADSVRWAVGRELLLSGLTDPAGEGDVQLFPSVDENGRAAVIMELCSPDGRLVTQMRTSDLYGFLSRTLAVVPLGAETIDLDLLVESLVGQSEPQ
ncbi:MULTISPECIES: SsgA family sporulation/cell division regulator [unclassified Nocardioides]|uniref:SsgA family sporulation/cell division regulator n=1 Tax=Nocardioides sp. URHA0032 TaxID=1380388 RepID=UPI00048B95F8|nr:SsgA family sporulation/cell division regulator [Nocardioides sp. URHA0032]